MSGTNPFDGFEQVDGSNQPPGRDPGQPPPYRPVGGTRGVGGTTGGGGWGGQGDETAVIDRVDIEIGSASAPLWLLFAAAACVLVSLAVVAFDSLVTHIIGYIGATAGAISLVCLFRVLDTRTRANSSDYTSRPEARWMASGILVVGMLVALPHVWAIAGELG